MEEKKTGYANQLESQSRHAIKGAARSKQWRAKWRDAESILDIYGTYGALCALPAAAE